MDARTGSKLRRLLRLGVSDGTNTGDAGMGELEMELALLREENARLKIERHRAPDAGRIIERMRHLGEEGDGEPKPDGETHSGETAQAIIECLAIRDALIEACQEVQQAMQGIRGRLGVLSAETLEPAGEPKVAAPIVTADATVDLELALGAAPSDLSDLSQSAA